MGKKVKIPKKMFKKLKEAKNKTLYLIFEEKEYQNIIKTKICNDFIVI